MGIWRRRKLTVQLNVLKTSKEKKIAVTEDMKYNYPAFAGLRATPDLI